MTKKNILSPYRNENILLKFILIQFRWKKFYDDMVNYHPEFSLSVKELISEPELLKNQNEEVIQKYQMILEHFKDKALYEFILNNKEIYKDTEAMEDYFLLHQSFNWNQLR